MLTPTDPESFKVAVLRRAARIERRRRLTRALMWIPGAAAVAMSFLLAIRPGAPEEQVRAGVAAQEASSAVLTTDSIEFANGAIPWAVVAASDGAIWVLERTEGGSSRISRIEGDTARAAATLAEGAAPEVLVAGPDQAVWMTDPAGEQILRVGFDGQVASWATTSPPSVTGTFAADGRFWYAEPAEDRLTGMAPDGEVIHHEVPQGRRPELVALGPDGSIFFSSSTSPRIGSISPSGTVTEYDLAPDEQVVTMAAGPGPALWMVLRSTTEARLARLNGQGDIVGQQVRGRAPEVMAHGSDGRLWYSRDDEAKVRQSTLRGDSMLDLDRPLFARSWAMGPDGTMWAVDRERRIVVSIAAG